MAVWYCSSVGWSAVTAWAASTAYNVGDIRRQLAAPTVGNERVWRCTTAGTSGASEPAWTLTKGSTTNDNTAVWTEITGSSTYNTPTSFAAPHARMSSLASWMAAGDYGYIANNHAETVAAFITVTAPGTNAAPNIFLSIDPATGLEASGASVSTTGTIAELKFNGSFYAKGLVIKSSEDSGVAGISLSYTHGNAQVWENCDFITTFTTSGAFIAVGLNSGGSLHVDAKLINCRIKFAGTGGKIVVYGNLTIHGGSFISGSAAITNFLEWPNAARGAASANVEGFDFTGAASTMNLVTGADRVENGNIRFSNCKMPASWTGLLVNTAIAHAGFSVDAWNIAASDINYVFWHERFGGSIKQDTGVYMTGGSTDGTTPFSVKMTSDANAEFPAFPLYTPEMVVRNETVGSAKTATVEITHSAAADLTDAEIWLEVFYLGTSGFPLSTLITDKIATVLGTPAAQTTSTQAWTGAGTRKQKLAVTFTPQEKGDIIWRVALAKASTTVYVNANLVIT